ncbi:MAG: DUF3052 family protein [Acidobacteria bacterium]|nr:DUF3052 family protein [Acidobacteriota bacterium]
MATSGYSGTPLPKKLGIRSGQVILLYKAPENYDSILTDVPDGVRFVKSSKNKVDMVHIFARTSRDLRTALNKHRCSIKEAGMIWVSWYKKASKIPTDVTEDTIREVCLPMGLVDIKVCAVDEKWSGLKLVIRKEDRKKPQPN